VLEENEREIKITQKWFSWSLIIPFIFCIAWFYISITMVRNGNLVPPAFGIGIIIIYSLMAGFLNRTIIKINNSEITVQHTPVPCPFYGNQKIDSSDLMQVVLQEFHKKGRKCCRVNALFKNNQNVTLLIDLTKEEATFITKEIETYLKLKEKRKKNN
ncbi:MAG: hypothetical protein ABRQ38_10030, partial [Candidatus Eremiobacterota bacterium]